MAAQVQSLPARSSLLRRALQADAVVSGLSGIACFADAGWLTAQLGITSADVYALGAILFEILAGEPLHPRGQGAIGSTLARPQQSPAQRRGGDVPPELDALCVAALDEDPAALLPAHALAEGFAFRFPTLERALDDLLRP